MIEESGEASDGWDMMDAQEASRVEEQQQKSAKGKSTRPPLASGARSRIATSTSGLTSPIKDARSSRSASAKPAVNKQGKKAAAAPAADSFDFQPPRDAPSYQDQRETVLRLMREQMEAFGEGDPTRVVLQEVYDKLARNVEGN